MVKFELAPGGHMSGRCRIPGDKSISHRAIMLASLSQGSSQISGYLASEDCIATSHAFELMGVSIEQANDDLVIHGAGLHGLKAPKKPIYLGNSGTGMRLMSGLLAGQAFDSQLTGDESLSSRPMGRVIYPLREMGADISGDDQHQAPLYIKGGKKLHGIRYEPPVASAQIKSCLLLAGLYACGETSIYEPGVSRDHSERMLSAFGADIHTEVVGHGRRITLLHAPSQLQAQDISVPADLSSAAFFIVAALIAKQGQLELPRIGLNPTRAGLLPILERMGARIEIHNKRVISGEPVGDLTVYPSQLKATAIGGEEVALAIDEFPAIFIAAACAQGVTTLTDAHELRVKESDRIAVMAEGLANLGVKTETAEDGMTIYGHDVPEVFTGGSIETYNDHRIAMAFSMAALRAKGAIVINHCDVVNTSFPQFVEQAAQVGLNIKKVEG